MAFYGPYPWCAAKKCPAPLALDCLAYITANSHNQTAQNFVACCKIHCEGRSANDRLLGLECGGASTATAVGTILYIVLLLGMGTYILAVGPFRRAKEVTFWVITIGSLIFMTGTGVFVLNVTSPFRMLQSIPALGAMNVAVFSYFYSGFQYGVGLAYEGGPLVVFVTTSFTIWKAIFESTPADGPLRDGNRLALVMLVMTLIWIVHSVSYRLYGYRVDWRLGSRWRNTNPRIQDPRFHLGAVQGHPTWRTPLGQSTSVVMTGLAWGLVRAVKEDLALQECRPDWVFHAMLYGAPSLISVSILWNMLSGIRCRTIKGLRVTPVEPAPAPRQPTSRVHRWLGRIYSTSISLVYTSQSQEYRETISIRKSDYPGLQPYKDLIHSFRLGNRYIIWEEYVQAVALQRMQRNTLFVESVPRQRLHWTDKAIGSVAWFLAQGGLVISIPAFFSLMLVATLLGMFFESINFRLLVETEVKDIDRKSAAEVLEQCHVGEGLNEVPKTWEEFFGILGDLKHQRSINLHTLLDNTGPCELYDLLPHAT